MRDPLSSSTFENNRTEQSDQPETKYNNVSTFKCMTKSVPFQI